MIRKPSPRNLVKHKYPHAVCHLAADGGYRAWHDESNTNPVNATGNSPVEAWKKLFDKLKRKKMICQ